LIIDLLNTKYDENLSHLLLPTFSSLYFFAAAIKLTNKGAGLSTVLFNSG
jgi:hypothetical protein